MAFLIYLEEFSGEALNNIGQMSPICHGERCVLGANLNWMHDAVSTYQDIIGSCSVEEYTASWRVANVAEYLKYALRILALVQQLKGKFALLLTFFLNFTVQSNSSQNTKKLTLFLYDSAFVKIFSHYFYVFSSTFVRINFLNDGML